MKQLIKFFVVIAVVVAMTGSAFAAERSGKVVRVKGSARYSTGNNDWQPVKAGMTLKPGSIVQTGPNSIVDIVLGEAQIYPPRATIGEVVSYSPPVSQQDVVRVWEDSVLAIDKLTTETTGNDTVTETELDLRHGRIFGSVKKLSAASKYEVKLPNGVAGIRGTVYTISADGVVTVLVGSVVVAYVGGDGQVVTQVVSAGYQFDARTGQITPIPVSEEKDLRDADKQTRTHHTGPTHTYVPGGECYVSPLTGASADQIVKQLD